MTEQERNILSFQILRCAYDVHTELGPGLLESTYEACLEFLLIENGIRVERQKELPVTFRGKNINAGYRVDLLVENEIILELKSVEELNNVHIAQTLTYLKLSKKRLGLLLNFNVTQLKKGIKRVVNKQAEEKDEDPSE